MTNKKATLYHWKKRTLDELVKMEAQYNDIKKGLSDAEADQDVLREAAKFEDELENALYEWWKRNPQRIGTTPDGEYYEPDDVMYAEAPYLVFMTLEGHGVGIWSGDWDHFFRNPRQDIPNLQQFLKRKLQHHTSEVRGGLKYALVEAAFETTGENERIRIQEEKDRQEEGALRQWQGDAEDRLFERKWAATRDGTPWGNVPSMYKAYKEEQGFLVNLAPTYKHLTKVQAVLVAYSAKISGTSYTLTNSEFVSDAASNVGQWLKYYELVRFKFDESRGALAGQLAYDLAKALPDWELNMAKWKKKATMVVVPLVKKNGRQIILKIKFPNIDNFEAQIGVPGSTVKFSHMGKTDQVQSFIHDAKDFIGQLIRLR